ncbi:MAG: hypothetical protein A3D96_03645 [Chlamydiae bacterium RIFCSPHIGHO2_12_FULL_44_59]|nr:MAG: hypothetical protein A2796_02330 [Chlamydiae bacterium RIFCSPHIGHO2_01_FULL_44_39]OGN57109.1 MAG: hypothetical protein A3C42_01695 [Chlamydiae bacterium RIFCSPHIGHO2_02_FULL_45_9]OGN59856.1 MAG: hypothetical protein A3D96_03645 [Chlamydiae bacterium RIFCSPHIGHO2_12_FULL_44_59]OGN66063.1 MAG: hypothetical protein A2978_04160 [Chlamydiae bacterium RIFCSPLOWO2_01_FULL_44_52]OGN68599.1 MAG: hypothetical protein A3I67_02485 [Chlamydiae bacterium RIFCSPLOWO2_02_FULL_45_22]OGN69711.1 MAG: hyp
MKIASLPTTTYSFLGRDFEMSVRDKKVVAVALACIGLFVLQLGLSLSLALCFTTTVTLLTYLFPREDQDWLSWPNDKSEEHSIKWISALLLAKPFLITLLFLALGLPLPGVPQVGILEYLMRYPITGLLKTSLLAPFTEEILFRGFLFERLEDLHLSRRVSQGIQAVLFGLAHLNKKIEEGYEMAVVLPITIFGYFLGSRKSKSGSLAGPLALHSASNLGAASYIFLRFAPIN